MNSLSKDKEIDQLMKTYENEILRTCFLILGDRSLAADALQDTFMKVWEKIDDFEGRNDSNIRTWIFRIAINTCNDYRRTFWYKHIDRKRSCEELLMKSVSPEKTDEIRMLMDEVMRLPQKQKEVILLHYYQNMTLCETAEILHISQPAVSKRLKKAISMMKTEVMN